MQPAAHPLRPLRPTLSFSWRRVQFECICWIPLGQNPNVEKLQELLHLQLTGGSALKAGLSEDERQEQLRQAMSSHRVLLVLDDLWSEQHERRLAFVDDSTKSKVLISSRVRPPAHHLPHLPLLSGGWSSVDATTVASQFRWPGARSAGGGDCGAGGSAERVGCCRNAADSLGPEELDGSASWRQRGRAILQPVNFSSRKHTYNHTLFVPLCSDCRRVWQAAPRHRDRSKNGEGDVD